MKTTKEYPLNLVEDILKTYKEKYGVSISLPKNIQPEKIDDVMGTTLTEKNKKCLLMRYADGMTYDEIGQIMGFCRSESGHHIRKSLYSLSTPDKVNTILYGEEYEKNIKNRGPKDWLDVGVEDLGLSRRVSNALRRRHTSYMFGKTIERGGMKTVKDLILYLENIEGYGYGYEPPSGRIQMISNLGTKGQEELFNFLKSKQIYGGTIDDMVLLIPRELVV